MWRPWLELSCLHVSMSQRQVFKSDAACRRDVIKAESAALSVPELDLEVTTGVFGGLVTTVEGLVVAVRCVQACRLSLCCACSAADLMKSQPGRRDSLQRMHAFQLGDSAAQVSLLAATAAWGRLASWIAVALQQLVSLRTHIVAHRGSGRNGSNSLRHWRHSSHLSSPGRWC